MTDKNTIANHQPQQLVINVPAIEGETEDAAVERLEAIVRSHGIDPASMVPIGGAPGQSSGIDETITFTATFGGELLAKVLPAGGPLLGQEPCPSCGHFPGEPRDNPFRRCVACGGAA